MKIYAVREIECLIWRCACGQAWERQVAELSRQVSRAAADKDDAERERQSLLDALRNSEQVLFFSFAIDNLSEDHDLHCTA